MSFIPKGLTKDRRENISKKLFFHGLIELKSWFFFNSKWKEGVFYS